MHMTVTHDMRCCRRLVQSSTVIFLCMQLHLVPHPDVLVRDIQACGRLQAKRTTPAALSPLGQRNTSPHRRSRFSLLRGDSPRPTSSGGGQAVRFPLRSEALHTPVVSPVPDLTILPGMHGGTQRDYFPLLLAALTACGPRVPAWTAPHTGTCSGLPAAAAAMVQSMLQCPHPGPVRCGRLAAATAATVAKTTRCPQTSAGVTAAATTAAVKALIHSHSQNQWACPQPWQLPQQQQQR